MIAHLLGFIGGAGQANQTGFHQVRPLPQRHVEGDLQMVQRLLARPLRHVDVVQLAVGPEWQFNFLADGPRLTCDGAARAPAGR